MLKAKDNIKLPHHFDIDKFVKNSKVSLQDIAKNIVNDQYPNGIPPLYLHQLILNGLNDNDNKVIYQVTQELCKQQNQRNHQKKIQRNQYLRDVDATEKRKFENRDAKRKKEQSKNNSSNTFY